MTRSVLEQMIAAYPDSTFAAESAPGGKAWALFDPVPGNPHYFGEDYSFCLRWRMIGGKVWIDPNLTLSHIGEKTFTGNFAEWARAKAA